MAEERELSLFEQLEREKALKELQKQRELRFLLVVRVLYVIALVYYLCTGDVLTDWLMIITVIGTFFSPIFYFILVGILLFPSIFSD